MGRDSCDSRRVLILMVKNESSILRRCLEAVEGLVDAFCITDTGSTDDTCDIVKEFLTTHKGCLTTCEWTNFGECRTISVRGAQTYLGSVLQWDLSTTYGLLLDADMIFVPGTLAEQTLTETGYTIVQKAGSLVYPNCRLIRLDYPWTCKGVTHEYWDGPTTPLPESVCYIDDRNDGGCKSDKFERDVRLLEQGLRDEPTNVRYLFYLAQTYNSLGRWTDAIAMYKRRFHAGGWDEERWFSLYMIGQCYLALKDPIKFEAWMLRAHAHRPGRAEAIYKLAKYFREEAQHYKSAHYVQLGMPIPLSSDSLFIETDVYKELFYYEQSILDYYIHPDRTRGLRSSMDYFLRGSSMQQSVLSNLHFYATPLGPVTRLTLPSPFGGAYRPSAISLRTYPYANVRYVNYWIENGDYKTPPGECVRTENAYVNLESGDVLARMADSSVTLLRRECSVKGLEDIRLYGSDRFTATVQEYGEGVRVLDGRYLTPEGRYTDYRVLESPTGRSCEKNWLPIADTGDMIYDWHPFRVLGPKACIHPTPPFFSLLRGSAPPVRSGSEWWVLTHLVHYSKPRAYFHCMVALDDAYVPRKVSLPFVFRSASIEYCVSMRLVGDSIECYVSFQDSESSRATIPVSAFQWLSI